MIDDPDLPGTGVIPVNETKARWCVWAPNAARVDLILDPGVQEFRQPMTSIGRGYFAVEAELTGPGQRYAYALDGGAPLADPHSRWQPDGVNQASAVWFPERFAWDEGDWTGIDDQSLVVYELHVGTFTPEGTFDAIIPRLGELRSLGITAIELMPIGQFPGSRSWGYDGVFLFAPQASYGGPEGLHRLVEACHRRGLAVILDAIYNHFGPEGNVLPRFGSYLTDRYKTDWGHAINYDGKGSDSVRAMVLDNVRMWVRDYHIDGLRLDAADQIYDRSPHHILAEITQAAHLEGRRLGRPVHLFVETDLNDAPRFLGSAERGGYGIDVHWNDDFHHAAHVCLTGETNGYYVDFVAGPAALAKAYERVFVNDGNYSQFRDRRHGTPATMFPGNRYLAFTQNHDQVGNRMKSDRYAAGFPASKLRLAAGILLLAPRLPMLFMGEEYGETNPFPYFCDFEDPALIEAVRQGRKAEFGHFGWHEDPPDAFAPTTRDLAVLSWTWNDPARSGLRRLYRDLLRFRRESPTLRDGRHAQARVLNSGDVLELVRGGTAPEPTPELRIYLNLSAEDRELPEGLKSEQPAFRSEVAAYGAREPDEGSRFNRLRPHEFLILGILI
ncbi:MAG: malto-oligosyltrehalose trehalohydrolase [Isosphaeraceae bacterium]